MQLIKWTGSLSWAAASLALLTLGACTNSPTGDAKATAAKTAPPDRIIKQDPGNITYWVLPGPRKLSAGVFGTPDNPKMTLKPKLKAAQQKVEAGKMPPTVPQLLKDLPILVGVPEKARQPAPGGGQMLKAPTPFSDDGLIIEGQFEAELWDNIDHDPPGKPGQTPDKAAMTAEFTDPQGNAYRVVLDHVVKPPFPGYNTDGGVLLDDYHHGATGTGSPLMPQVWTLGAFWGVGNVYIDGELVEKKRVMHLMTSEIVRDNNYHLALQSEMPLSPQEWLVKDQPHHTHLIVLPIRATKRGPVFDPVETAFQLPNGKSQPFMHIMFEQDSVVR